MFYRVSLVALAFIATAVPSVVAVCSGHDFAIGNVIPNGGGASVNRWNVYDVNCNVHDGLSTTGNPCTQGIFGCSPPPIIFDQYIDRNSNRVYHCHRDDSFERCGQDVISVCCAL